ncbi:hypothetical protein MTR67_045282 [Solanum verrucosum]|uniref:Reverse transcriptase zinc-binding domain-containing protein n=1 Tax=Solanum verrucosum TaxID=315347 RepID=A0AAF0UT11_SOLVR|nr:hypothetical protein MTR67_045282 [Solanum verrucosum]
MLRVPVSTPSSGEMEHNNTHQLRSRSHHQFHPSRPAILDLFNLYLGLKNSGQKSDDSIREPPNKTQKRVTALNRELPPRNEQFLLDFGQLQSQFTDKEQLSAVTESVLISLVIHCSSHAPRAEFILFAICSLSSIGFINWDTFLPSLLSSVSSTEISASQANLPSGAVSSANLTSGLLPSSTTVASTSIFHSSNPASPLPTVHGIGSPLHSAAEPSSSAALSPMKSSDVNGTSQQSIAKVNVLSKDNATSSLRQLCCKIILTGLDSNLKPVTHAEVFHHMLNWLINWDQKLHGVDELDSMKYWKPDKALIKWLHSCLDVIWLLVENDKCRIPFYELLRSGLQFLENIPDDEALFTLILEIHRRRDMMAMHMQMLDQHLHCPTFGTPRLLPQATANSSGEAVANIRYSPITYPSVLGEPLHGEIMQCEALAVNYEPEAAFNLVRGIALPDCFPRSRIQASGWGLGQSYWILPMSNQNYSSTPAAIGAWVRALLFIFEAHSWMLSCLSQFRSAAHEVFDQEMKYVTWAQRQDLAASIQEGSLDWERALRCLKHALRNTPSPDWWRRVLLVAPCHRVHAQAPTPGAVFTSEMVCEAVIERIVELLKLTNSGNILRLQTLLEIVLRVANLYISQFSPFLSYNVIINISSRVQYLRHSALAMRLKFNLHCRVNNLIENKKNNVFSDGHGIKENADAEEDDVLLWQEDSKGDFSVKFAYKALNRTGGQEKDWPWKMIWKPKVPYKVNCFTWLLAKEAVLTHENLNKRGYQLASRCYLCGEQAETVNHLFLHCKWTKQLWRMFTSLKEITWVKPGCIR